MKLLGLLVALALVFAPATAHAQSDTASLFTSGVHALREGKASDAIGSFEALADRGVVDAVASYDRGLAYALRIRVGGEVPGDLGRAAQGFEEARDLTRDPKLADDASTALTVIRSEVARRRTQAGEPVEVDPGRSLARSAAALVSESAWAWMAAVISFALSAGVFVRRLARGRRARVGGGVVAGVAAPALVAAVAMTLLVRHDREWLHEAVVVSDSARPADERGIVLAGAFPLPEGARVEILDSHGASTEYRFGSTQGWVPTSSLRELAR
jgi:hypothetical protein